MAPSTGRGALLQRKERNCAISQRYGSLLAAVQKPRAVAVVHVSGHQSARTSQAEENRPADKAAKKAAVTSPTLALALPTPELPRLPLRPDYTPEDLQWIQSHYYTRPDQHGWHRDREERLITAGKTRTVPPFQPAPSHPFREEKIADSSQVRPPPLVVPLTTQIQEIVDQCVGCQAMKPSRKGPLRTG